MNKRNTKEISPRGSGAVFSSCFCRWVLGTSPTPMAARMLSIEITSSGQACNEARRECAKIYKTVDGLVFSTIHFVNAIQVLI